jgi:integrase
MQLIDEFCKSLKHSMKTNSDKKLRLNYANDFFSKEGYEDAFTIPPIIFRKYFEKIDSLDIVIQTKKRYTRVLQDYFDYLEIVEHDCRKLETEYKYDKIFSTKFYSYKDFQKVNHQAFININEVFRILEWAKYTKSPKFYFLTCLLATTGSRFGQEKGTGMSHITRDQIDFHTRFMRFESKGKENLYIISRNLVEPLRNYVRFLAPSENQLFRISMDKYNQTLQKFRDDLSSHIFRDSISSTWEDADIKEEIRAIMLNQKPEGVNSRYYLKRFKDWRIRKDRYDKIDPFRDFNF